MLLMEYSENFDKDTDMSLKQDHSPPSALNFDLVLDDESLS